MTLGLGKVRAALENADKFGHGCDGCGCSCCSFLPKAPDALEALAEFLPASYLTADPVEAGKIEHARALLVKLTDA